MSRGNTRLRRRDAKEMEASGTAESRSWGRDHHFVKDELSGDSLRRKVERPLVSRFIQPSRAIEASSSPPTSCSAAGGSGWGPMFNRWEGVNFGPVLTPPNQ
jgi:hypothetical protein